MKWIVCVVLLAANLVSAQAQLFGPESLTGGLIGGIAGGVIGHNSGRRTAEGAAIGAGAGLFLGALTSHAREPDSYYDSYSYYRPNYAVTGAVLGGVAGGVIGHNNGRRTGEGVAIGAGAGLLIGGMAEYDARARGSSYVYSTYYPGYYPRTVVVTRPVVWQPHATTVIVRQAPTPPPQPGQTASVQAATPDAAPSLIQVPGTPGNQPALGSANGLFGR